MKKIFLKFLALNFLIPTQVYFMDEEKLKESQENMNHRQQNSHQSLEEFQEND